MKYWIDTEFIAKPYTIDLVSVGIVAEDGREFYAESSDVDWSKANPWMQENVRPQLGGKAGRVYWRRNPGLRGGGFGRRIRRAAAYPEGEAVLLPLERG